jgi:hypothetical protein
MGPVDRPIQFPEVRNTPGPQRMNFDEEAAAHAAWKRKLNAYLVKRDGSLKSHEVSADDHCPLGQWIYGPGAKYSHLPEYSVLKSEHARFHKAGGEIVDCANAGQSADEQIVIGSHSEFTQASSAVMLAIMAIKKRVSE